MPRALIPDRELAQAAQDDYDAYNTYSTIIETALAFNCLVASVLCVAHAVIISEGHFHQFDWQCALAALFSVAGLLNAILLCARSSHSVSKGLIGLPALSKPHLVVFFAMLVIGVVYLSTGSETWPTDNLKNLWYASKVFVFVVIVIGCIFFGIVYVRPANLIRTMLEPKMESGHCIEMGPVCDAELRTACVSTDAWTMTKAPKEASPASKMYTGQKMERRLTISSDELNTAKKNLRRTSMDSVDSIYGLNNLKMPNMMPIVVEDLLEECKPVVGDAKSINSNESVFKEEAAELAADLNSRLQLLSKAESIHTPTIPPPPIPDCTPAATVTPVPSFTDEYAAELKRGSVGSSSSKHSERLIS